MTLTITDQRTTADSADSLTGWSSPVAAEALTLFSSDPNPVELSNCIGMAVSTETSDLIFTITSADLSDTMVYVWMLANGTMDTLTNGGIALILGDATNLVGYHLAGSDVAGFRHGEGPVGWQCLMVDTSSLPASTTQLQGASAPTLTTITRIGAMYKTLSKALGGASNCFTDSIRYGNSGILITAGTSGSPGTFDLMAIEDRSDTSGKAYGVIRELGAGLYGIQAPLIFGDNGGTAASWFQDADAVISFEDRDIGTDKYGITVQGNSTGSTTFHLGVKVGTVGGSNGCTLLSPVGIGAHFTASDANLQFLKLYGCVLSGFDAGVNLSQDATNAPNHEIFATAFSGCGQIDPGLILFKNNDISSSTDANGSLLIDASGTGNLENLRFTSDGTGHAIYITAAGTYTFTNFTYTNFGADATTDAAVYNNSGGVVTINNAGGGDTPTVRNGTSATTTVNNAVTLRITVTDSGGSVISGARVEVSAKETVGTITDGDVLLTGITNGSGIIEDTGFNYEAAFDPSGLDVKYKVRLASVSPYYAPFDALGVVTATGFIVTVALQLDE